MNKYNVIFHIDEFAKGGLVLNNISNLIVDMSEENLEIEMVANGDAVKVLLKGNEFQPMLEQLALKKVRFCACANSLRNFKLEKDQLYDFVDVVPAGVGELVRKQASGWAYIRP